MSKGKSNSVARRISRIPKGRPFTTRELLSLGPRHRVDKALSRLARSKEILRIHPGVYVRPEQGRLGPVLPTPESVARAVARSRGQEIGIHGAVAANRLGLTSQVPVRPVFHTTGPSMGFRLGRLQVRLQRAEPRKLALAGSPAGEALSALRYLGRENVTAETIGTIRAKLPASEYRRLVESAHLMPAWLASALRKHASGDASA